MPRKCEWFEDVKLQTVNTPTQEDVSESVSLDDQGSSNDVTIEEKRSGGTYGLDEDTKGIDSFGSLLKYDENALKNLVDDFSKSGDTDEPAEKSPDKVSNSAVTEDRMTISPPPPKHYTREQIIEAVEYANRREKERADENSATARICIFS